MNTIEPKEKIYKLKTIYNMEKQVMVGKVSDSMEKLENLCKEKAERMVKK